MQRLLLTSPAITVAEAAFLAFAFIMLLLVPVVFAFVDRRRQASGARFPAASEPPAIGSSAAAQMSPVEEPTRGSQIDELWTPWPVAPPPPSVDPWHPEEAEAKALGPAPGSTRDAAVAPEAPGSNAVLRRDATSDAPPAFGAVDQWQEPARSYDVLPQLPETVPPSLQGRTRLELLREVSLATWPGVVASFPQSVRTLWDAGVRSYREWHIQIGLLELPLPDGMGSYALGRVESDGAVTRLHFLVFEHLWPAQPDEARALVVIDVHRVRGPIAFAVVSPTCAR